MKKYYHSIICILLLVYSWANNHTNAQHILNGSFEINNLNARAVGGVIGNAMVAWDFKYVEYVFADTNLYGNGSIVKNYLNYYDDSINFKNSGFSIKPAPHGITYIVINKPYNNGPLFNKPQQVLFLLSDSLTIGKRYVIRYYAGNSNIGAPSNEYMVVAAGTTNKKVGLVIDSIAIKDASGYREYVTSFVADSNYKYIYLYLVNTNYFPTYIAIDHIRLDSCVQLTNTQYIDCTQSSALLKPISISADNKYYWSTGDITNTIYAKKEGSYKAYTYAQNGCTQVDSFVVSLKPIVGIITNTNLCQGNSLTLKAAAIGNIYTWNTGDTTQTITIKTGGNYWVTRNVNTCSITDTFIVAEHPLPIINLLPDTIVCFSKIAQILLDAGPFKSYLWKPTNETKRIIYANAAQNYTLQVTDSNNCEVIKQITVTENCQEHVNIPNAFSPNGDGLNDVFNIVTTGVESYEMQIYNRWGIQVFSSQNYLQGWDGKNAPNDVYLVQVTYKLKDKPTQILKGNVTLIR